MPSHTARTRSSYTAGIVVNSAGTGGAVLELGGGARVYQAVCLQRLEARQRQATPLAHVVPTQQQ